MMCGHSLEASIAVTDKSDHSHSHLTSQPQLPEHAAKCVYANIRDFISN